MMMQVINTVVSILLTTVTSYLVWLLQRRFTVKSAESRALKALLRKELHDYHEVYCKRGSITSDEYEEYTEMYQTYHELGGNGTGTKWFHEVDSLHIKD